MPSTQTSLSVTYDSDTQKFTVDILDATDYYRSLVVWDKKRKLWFPIQDDEAYKAIENKLRELVENVA